MPTQETSPTQIKEAPAPNAKDYIPPKGARLYTLYFFKGSSSPLSKMFWFDGNLRAATVEARRHATAFGIRFLFVRPAIVDLREQERMREDSLDTYNEDDQG
jgi:hypothetical protein